MTDQKIRICQQENLLALMLFNDEHGKIVAGQVKPELFEGDYRILAERAIEYWREHKKAPHLHIADLIANLLEDRTSRRANTYRYILSDLLELSKLKQFNTDYVLGLLDTFNRTQQIKGVILQSIEKINHSEGEQTIAEVEELWSSIQRTQRRTFDAGISGDDLGHFFKHLDARKYPDFCTGIPLLDQRHVVPARGTIMVLLGPTGTGKSWFLQWIGRQALTLRMRVLHVTLELSARLVQERYLQSDMALAAWDDKRTTMRPVLNLNEQGELIGIDQQEVTTKFAMHSESEDDQRKLQQFIREHCKASHNRYAQLKIKKYPMRGLTIGDLRAYINGLEAVGFLPDMLLLDYVGIMQADSDNYRVSLGRTMEELRGLADEKNIAVVTAQQVSKAGKLAKQVDMTHVAEDWSIVSTADFVLTLSRSDREKQRKLARLFVDKNREGVEHFGVVLAQNYDHGQFVLDSAPLHHERYHELLERESKEG